MSYSNDPLMGPDGQPMLAMVGDLGDTLVSGGTAPSGTSGGGSTPSPVSGNGSGLVINVTYDQPTSSLPSGFVTAVNYVVNYFESLFSVSSTVNIEVGYGEIGGQAMEAGALGESASFLGRYDYGTIKSALANADPSAAANLPASQPVSGTMWVPTAEAKALGLTPIQPTTDLDGYVGFSSSLPFTYDPNNRAVAGKYDFIGVVEHEFSEVMGRIDLFNATLSDGANYIFNTYSPFDLFHYTSSGVHTYTGRTTNYFSVDGGHTNLDYFNSNASGDLGDWAASAGADAQLAFSPSGQANLVTSADITALNALGYKPGLVGAVIEVNGAIALVENNNNYYLDPSGGGTGPTLKYGGSALPISSSGWHPIAAEQAAGGYEIAWQFNNDASQYTVWDTDSSGNFTSDTIGTVPATNSVLEALEPSFHQDLNGDGVIGVTETIVESSGSTSLVQIGGNYFFNPVAGGAGPMLQYGGAAVAANSSSWHPIGVETTATGYEVVWEFSTQSQYTVWNTDSRGNFSFDTAGTVSGSSYVIEGLESKFQQDLNSDGHIGLPGGATVVEASGAIALVVSGDAYYLDPVDGGTGPTVEYGGSIVPVAEASWQAIGAEATAGGGYEVAWKFGGQNTYTVWNLDSSGNFASDTAGNLSGAGVELIEQSFQQDLNGDGSIGPTAPVTIESFGSTALVESGDAYFLNPVGGGTGPTVKYGGAGVSVASSSWQAIAAEPISGGYEVAWKFGAQDLYTIWSTDSSGNFVADSLAPVSGSSPALIAYEADFHQDLNGNSLIGSAQPAHAGDAGSSAPPPHEPADLIGVGGSPLIQHDFI